MAKAYLATSGSYSDYRVQRVFLDVALANKYRDEGFCEEIAEFEITDTEVKSVSILHMQWISAHRGPDGPIEAGEWSYVDHVEYAGQPPCKHAIHHLKAGLVGSARTIVAVEGHDSERVRKVFSEQVAMVKATLAEPGEGDQ